MKAGGTSALGRFSGPNAASRLEAVLDQLGQIAAELPPEGLPDLFAGLERARRVAELQLLRAERPTAEPPSIPRLLSVNEVANAFGVERQTVYRWAKGKLQRSVVRLGDGSIRFDPRKIQKFIDARRA